MGSTVCESVFPLLLELECFVDERKIKVFAYNSVTWNREGSENAKVVTKQRDD